MRRSRAPAILALGLAALAAAPRPACPQTQTAAETETRLAKIKQEIESLKVKIAGEDKKEKTMLSALDRIGFMKSLIRNELALLQIDLDKNRHELQLIKVHIPTLEADLERERAALAKVLVTLYKHGQLNAVRFILLSPSLRVLIGQAKNLAALAAAQDAVIVDYARGLAELGREADRLKAKDLDIQNLIRQATAKRAELEAEEAKSRALLGQIKSNRTTYEQTLEELGLRARELQQLLQKFETQETLLPFPLVPFTEKKGKLPWPTAGKVQQPFGLQRGPFNTVTMNNGIEIAPPAGDPAVRAVHAGKVVFADYFQGYGNLLIIDHGLTYYSLYGHCAEFLVAKGDFVKSGQPVAVTGDTGSMVGLSLYFEIRFKTKPLDPLQWLGRR